MSKNDLLIKNQQPPKLLIRQNHLHNFNRPP